MFSIYMLIVQNLAKENYLLKFKMAAMPIYGKKRSNIFFSKTTVPIRLTFCMKHMGHLTVTGKYTLGSRSGMWVIIGH